MQTEASIDIARPIREVFDYTTNHVAEWSLVVAENQVQHETPHGVGTTFRVITQDHGRRMVFDGVVTRHDPPVAHTVEMKGRQFDMTAEYLFESLGNNQTRVRQRAAVKAKGWFSMVFFVLSKLAHKSACQAQTRELENLKALLESGR